VIDADATTAIMNVDRRGGSRMALPPMGTAFPTRKDSIGRKSLMSVPSVANLLVRWTAITPAGVST